MTKRLQSEIRKMPRPAQTNMRQKFRRVTANARWVLREARAVSAAALYSIIVCRILNSAIPAALMLIGRGMINAVVAGIRHKNGDIGQVFPWILASLALVLVMEVVALIDHLQSRRLEERLSLRIDMEKLHHAAKLDISQVEDPEFQDIAERARQNSTPHFVGFFNKFLTLTTDILKIVGLTAILLYIDAFTVLVTIPVLIPFVLFKWSISKTRYWKEFARANKRRWMRYYMSNLTSRNVVGEVKILGLAPLFTRQYKDLAVEFLQEDHRIHRRDIWGTYYLSLVFTVLFYALFYRIVTLVLSHSLTIGDLTIILTSLGRLRDLLSNLAIHFTGTLEETLYIDNLSVFLKIKPKVVAKRGAQPLAEVKGEITFEDVSFNYAGNPREVLSDISFSIKPGETVALVGENGAGKTTMAKLLARLYDPVKGRILLDGRDLRDVAPEDLHAHMAFVFQEPNRFEATIAENIAYGCGQETLDRAKVEEIARKAGVNEFIQSLPKGYDTSVGKTFSGIDLSGGQWQRMAIARSLVRENAGILILDEPTASMDARAEYELFCRFRELAAGRTTVLISHRFSTVSLADRIVVLGEGRIVESGTHEELLSHGGHYAELYRLHQMQMERGEEV